MASKWDNSLYKTCPECGEVMPLGKFIKVKSEFFLDGIMPFCEDCLAARIKKQDGSLNYVSRICQWMNVPFLPGKWIELYETNPDKAFSIYSKVQYNEEWEKVDWNKQEEKYKELKNRDKLDDEIPLLKEEKLADLRQKWGQEYNEDELRYMENLYQGTLRTQNISGTLQMDDLLKLCKISLLMDQKIRAGEDIDKILKSYDTLRKTGEFTTKTAKSACDFDSIGELFAYCEKHKWQNKFYDGATRDTVDLTMKDIQAWIRNLYKNESGISEDVDRRIKALQIADSMEQSFMSLDDNELDKFDNDALNLEFDDDDNDFDAEANR